jgi:hypothetical protein
VYTWIWRHIPFRQWQLKTAVSLVLVAAVGALLWFKVFPWVEPILPLDDGQIEDTGGQPVDTVPFVEPTSAEPSPTAPAGANLPGPDVLPSVRSSR